MLNCTKLILNLETLAFQENDDLLVPALISVSPINETNAIRFGEIKMPVEQGPIRWELKLLE